MNSHNGVPYNSESELTEYKLINKDTFQNLKMFSEEKNQDVWFSA